MSKSTKGHDVIRAYHFTGTKLRDGRPIPRTGEWLIYDGKVEMCSSGLHASREPWDALQYAPGPFLHLVDCDEVVQEYEDKLVCRRRRIVDTIDATELLSFFARMQALAVMYPGDVPDVVLDYLMTGDESLRAATRAAAMAAAAFAAEISTAFAATNATRATAADFNGLVYETFDYRRTA